MDLPSPRGLPNVPSDLPIWPLKTMSTEGFMGPRLTTFATSAQFFISGILSVQSFYFLGLPILDYLITLPQSPNQVRIVTPIFTINHRCGSTVGQGHGLIRLADDDLRRTRKMLGASLTTPNIYIYVYTHTTITLYDFQKQHSILPQLI